MLPTFFSYSAISYMLFCFLPFLCLFPCQCEVLCFTFLLAKFFFFHPFLPHFPINSLIMQLKHSTFPLSSPRRGLILFLIEETEAMNFMILYVLSLESTFEHLFFLVVQCPVAYQCLVFLTTSLLQYLLYYSFVYSSCHPVITSLSTYLLTFVLNTSGVWEKT